MQNKKSLHLDVLPPEQRELWPMLRDTPKQFVLYGGTAVALQLGHRKSVDFDFFCAKPFNPDEMLEKVPYLSNAHDIRISDETLKLKVEMSSGESVDLSYFDVNKLQIKPPIRAADNGVKIASVLDLLGMKCATVSQRIEVKDYLDIHAILSNTSYTLANGISAAATLYPEYHPTMTIRALQDTGRLVIDEEIKKTLRSAVDKMQTEDFKKYKTKGRIGTLIAPALVNNKGLGL